MSKKNKNDFLLQGGLLAAAGLITRLIGLVYRIPLTRIVGKEGMAYYNTAYEIYNMVLIISTYSMPVALSKIISNKDSNGEYHNSNKMLPVAFITAGSIGLVFALLLFIFAKPLATFMGYPSAALPLKVLSPTVFVFSLMGIIRGFFQGKKTMVPTAFSQIIEQIFNAVFSIVAAILLINSCKDTMQVASYGAAGGTTGTITGAIFGLFVLIFILYINRGYFKRKERKDITGKDDRVTDMVKLLIFTMLPIILSQTIYQLSGIIDNSMFGRIMEGKGFIESERAIMWEAYSNKYKWLYNLPIAIASAFSVSIVPELTANYNQHKISLVKEKIASSIKVNMLIAIPSAFGLIFLARPILVLLFNDPEDTLAPNLMMLGGVAVIFFALSTFTNGILQGINRMDLPVIHSGISLGIHVILVYVLVSVFDYGIYGMVIGNVSYGLLVSILNCFSIAKILDYRQEVKTTFLIPLGCSLAMGICGFGLYSLIYLLIPINEVAVIPALIFSVLVYFVLMLLTKGVTEEELLALPKGSVFVRFAKKIKLL